MAPRKRKEAEPAQPGAAPGRVTRAATKRGRGAANAELAEKKGKGKRKKQEEAGKEGEMRPRKEEEAEKEGETGKGEGDSGNVGGASGKTIVVEHCKQCNSFKTRATLVKEGLEKRATGITVIVNPEKPRRGCFEIRDEGGKKFISLLDMKRPFTPMKNLDMDKVISDIIDEILSTS